jgi:hypothetical protein
MREKAMPNSDYLSAATRANQCASSRTFDVNCPPLRLGFNAREDRNAQIQRD